MPEVYAGRLELALWSAAASRCLACVEEGRSGCAHYFVAVCRDGTWQVEPPTRLCFAPGC